MEIGLFIHNGKNGLIDFIAEELADFGHNVTKNETCLCNSSLDLDLLQLGELTIIHPADHRACYKRISEFVDTHKSNQFYIFALQEEARKHPRIAGIGQHNNVTYITEDNLKTIWQEIGRRPSP